MTTTRLNCFCRNRHERPPSTSTQLIYKWLPASDHRMAVSTAVAIIVASYISGAQWWGENWFVVCCRHLVVTQTATMERAQTPPVVEVWVVTGGVMSCETVKILIYKALWNWAAELKSYIRWGFPLVNLLTVSLFSCSKLKHKLLVKHSEMFSHGRFNSHVSFLQSQIRTRVGENRF